MSLNVKVKKLPNSTATKNDILSILRELQVNASHIKVTRSSDFLICCNSSKDVDVIFSEESGKLLLNKKCQTVLLPVQKANRTIFLKNFDESIYEKTDQEIIAEVKNRNNMTAVEVYKFPNKKFMKITLESLEQVKQALDKGILLFFVSIPAHSISVENFIDLQVCFKCYAIENHTTTSCPKDNDYKVCSLCASTNHTFRNCNQPNVRKCINCDGQHGALAMRCPFRKDKIKEKRSIQQSNNTYSNAVKSSSFQPKKPDQKVEINMFVTYLHLYMTARENSDKTTTSVETELNKLLQKNKLPPIKLNPTSISLDSYSKTSASNNRPSAKEPSNKASTSAQPSRNSVAQKPTNPPAATSQNTSSRQTINTSSNSPSTVTRSSTTGSARARSKSNLTVSREYYTRRSNTNPQQSKLKNNDAGNSTIKTSSQLKTST